MVVTFPSLFFITSIYAFSAINNQNLQNLWDWNQHNLAILNGRLFFRLNPKLCISEIHKMWEKTGKTEKPEEGDFLNNGEQASCEYLFHVTFGQRSYKYIYLIYFFALLMMLH